MALSGVQKQLALMTTVFGATVLLGAGALGFLYSKASDFGEAAARIETRLANIEGLLNDVRTTSQKTIDDLGKIKGALKIADAGSTAPIANGAPAAPRPKNMPATTQPDTPATILR